MVPGAGPEILLRPRLANSLGNAVPLTFRPLRRERDAKARDHIGQGEE
jgi:hypothetical protein